MPSSLTAGFRFAHRGSLKVFHSSLIEPHHSMDAVVDRNGVIRFDDKPSLDVLNLLYSPVRLYLTGKREGNRMVLKSLELREFGMCKCSMSCQLTILKAVYNWSATALQDRLVKLHFDLRSSSFHYLEGPGSRTLVQLFGGCMQ